ncbi:MAG: response regulator [bacterium]
MALRKKILIVDDEEDITWGISKCLDKTNDAFEVHCVHTGDQALEILKKFKFDLVVSDIRMPGRNGLELLLDIRKQYPHTKIIIMTAYGSQEIKELAEKRGSFFYIEKPFEMGYLKQLILEALEINNNGFKGYLHNAGIRELVEFNCASKRTSSLFVSKDKEQQGIIYFKNGDVVHAECGNLIGERALLSILNWSEGNFKILPNVLAIKRTILRDWRTLLHQSI